MITNDQITALVDKAEMIAWKMCSKEFRSELDEVRGEARLALVKAAKKFESSLGVPFERYASHRIEWALRDYFRRRMRSFSHLFRFEESMSPTAFSLVLHRELREVIASLEDPHKTVAENYLAGKNPADWNDFSRATNAIRRKGFTCQAA